ncbi:WD40 domain-containing protein, partial [Aureobasidium melanogenum]
DYISSLTPLPASETSTSGYSKQWVTTGGTTLSVTDLRRGVLVRSEDQEEILLSSCFVSGLPARKSSSSKGEKLVVGGGDGVITLWERGVWDDQDERITVDRSPGGGESLDVIRLLPPDVGPGGKVLAVGMGDGKVRFVKLGPNKVISEITHDEVEGVVSLDFDVAGRLITAGGSTIKVWHEMVDEDQHAYLDGDLKREAEDSDAGSDDDSDMDSDDSSDEETGRKRRKKRKRAKGKDKSGGANRMGSFAGLD